MPLMVSDSQHLVGHSIIDFMRQSMFRGAVMWGGGVVIKNILEHRIFWDDGVHSEILFWGPKPLVLP